MNLQSVPIRIGNNTVARRASAIHEVPMKTLTPAAQLDRLERGLNSHVGGHLHRWLIGLGLGLIVLSGMLWHPWPLMIGGFLALVGLLERRAVPNIRMALQAYANATPGTGTVVITVTHWDTDDHYHAEVRESGQPVWIYEFIPQGWHPLAETCPADIWRLEAGAPPALVMVQAGVLIPRYPPQRLDS